MACAVEHAAGWKMAAPEGEGVTRGAGVPATRAHGSPPRRPCLVNGARKTGAWHLEERALHGPETARRDTPAWRSYAAGPGRRRGSAAESTPLMTRARVNAQRRRPPVVKTIALASPATRGEDVARVGARREAGDKACR